MERRSNLWFLSLLLLLLGTSACAKCPIVLAQDPPLQLTIRQPTQATPRITGGELVSRNLYPYLVAMISDSQQLCTGVLISPHWFLTAAHCDPTITSRAMMSSSQVGIDGIEVNITNVYIHPRFAREPGKRRYDIAAIEIEEDARTLGGKFMRLSFRSRTPVQDSFVRTVGFGRIRERGGYDPFPFALRQVDIPVADNWVCRKNYAGLQEPTTVSKEFHFCAGYVIDGGCDACNGDSGGPVIQYAGRRPVLQGLVSTGAGCGYPGYPGLNVRISAMKKWLISTPAKFTKQTTKAQQVFRNCGAGKYLPYVQGKVAKCEKCPSDMYTGSSQPRRLCDQCPETLLRDTETPSKCSCRAAVGLGLVNGTCMQCQPGFYSGRGENLCKTCPVGTYSAESGSGKCKQCKTAKRGATECLKR